MRKLPLILTDTAVVRTARTALRLLWLRNLLGLGVVVAGLPGSAWAQNQVVDCGCVQSNLPPVVACQATIPDLCALAQCLIPGGYPPSLVICTQWPAAGTPVGPGVHSVVATWTAPSGLAESCTVPFVVQAPAGGCGTNPCVMPPLGMVGWWPLDDATNQSTVVDLAGSHHGTSRNAANALVNIGPPPVWSLPDPAVFGGALTPVVTDPATSPPRGALFLSGQGFVEVPHHPSLNIGSNGLTLTLWTWPTLGSGGPQPLVEKYDLPGNNGYCLYWDPVGSGNFVLKFLLNGTVVTGATVAASVSPSDWRFVVARVGGGGTVTLSVCDAVGSCAVAPMMVVSNFLSTNTAPLWFGKSVAINPAVVLFATRVGFDEIELFDRALTQTELQQIYDGEKAGTRKCVVPTGVAEVCIFKFDDTNGNGQPDPGENGLPGWQFTISPAPLPPTTSPVTTGPGGRICFAVAAPGTYTISEIGQAGWTPTTPSSQTITVAPGQVSNVAFGNRNCVSPPAGMVAWWPLDEANGALTFAELQAGLNANIVPGPLGTPPSPNAVPGQVAGGAYFPVGHLGYGAVPSNPVLDVAGTNFTIDAWIYPVGCGPQQVSPIVDKLRLGDPLSGYALGLLGGQLVLALGDPTFGPPAQLYTCTLPVPIYTWNFVAVSVNFAAGTVTFFVNGAVQTISSPAPAPKLANTNSLWIGSSRTFFAQPGHPHCEIGLDEVEIFDCDLSPSSLSQIFGAGPAGKCKPACTVSITCPTNVVVNTCSNSAVVIYPAPQASSPCGVVPTVSCVPPSGFTFPLGITTVTCTATVSPTNSASCTFTVTVLGDTTPPALNCVCLTNAPFLPPLSVQGCRGVIPNLCEAARRCATDNCGPVTCSQTPPAGTPVGPGIQPITVTVTDAAGNSSSCVVNFTVVAPSQTLVWHTGVSGPTAANFTVIQTPSGPANIPAVPTAIATGAWAPNGPVSSWISFTTNSANAPPGLYVYRLAFDVGCSNGASLVGRILVDDAAAIWLNGQPTGQPTFSSFSTWAPVNLTAGFVSGLNTLDVYVTNAVIWTGLRAELTNTFNCCCPEAIVLNCPTGMVAQCVCPGVGMPVPYSVTASNRCGTPVSVVCQPPSPGPFPPGTTVVTCTATDGWGNQATCSFPVTVVPDTVPPTISCPGPITQIVCTNAQAVAVPVYFTPKVKDNCPASVMVSCTPPSGSLFPLGTTIVTCTATDACGNTNSCSFPVTVNNIAVWQTLPKGLADCYARPTEPAVPGTCLSNAYPGPWWKNFDDQTVNRRVGVTWNFPPSWNILNATLHTRLRPPVNGCSGGSANDSISLGLTSCGPPAWLWSRYLGSNNPAAGLFAFQWCNGSGCNHDLNLNLAALPQVPSGTVNLLPHMNSTKRLDLFVQDDTTVDFAYLRVQRCQPIKVVGGVPVSPNNARIIYGPEVWTLERENTNAPGFCARFDLGRAAGLLLPIEPLALTAHPGASIQFGPLRAVPGQDDDCVGWANDQYLGLRLEASTNGTGRVVLSQLPPGQDNISIELILEVEGVVIQRFPPAPAQAGQVVAIFDSADQLVELGILNLTELIVSAQSPNEDGSQSLYTLRVLADWPGKDAMELAVASLALRAEGLDQLTLEGPAAQLRGIEKKDIRRGLVIAKPGSGTGAPSARRPAQVQVEDEHVVLSPLDNDGPDYAALDLLFLSDATETNRATQGIKDVQLRVAGLEQDSQEAVILRQTRPTRRGVIVRILSVTQLERTHGGWTLSSPAAPDPDQFQLLQAVAKGLFGQQILNLQMSTSGWAGLGECAEPPPIRAVTVQEPPGGPPRLSYRLVWPQPVSFQNGSNALEITELELLFAPPQGFDGNLAGLSFEATGTQALIVSSVGLGPEDSEIRRVKAEMYAEDISLDGGSPGTFLRIRWDGIGGVLEQAESVAGPWRAVPEQVGQSQGDVFLPLEPAQPIQFFRVRY